MNKIKLWYVEIPWCLPGTVLIFSTKEKADKWVQKTREKFHCKEPTETTLDEMELE